MAKADYALCAHCDGKAFYDAETDTLDTVTFHPDCLAAHDRAVKAEGWDEGYARAKSSHCDAWPSAAYCDVTDDNPHRADQIEGATE